VHRKEPRPARRRSIRPDVDHVGGTGATSGAANSPAVTVTRRGLAAVAVVLVALLVWSVVPHPALPHADARVGARAFCPSAVGATAVGPDDLGFAAAAQRWRAGGTTLAELRDPAVWPVPGLPLTRPPTPAQTTGAFRLADYTGGLVGWLSDRCGPDVAAATVAQSFDPVP
jgi:hypothetical protein